MQVKDIMTPTVFSVGPDTSAGEIAELLLEKKISAVPVLDKDGILLGIVSEGDLVRRLAGDRADTRPWWVSFLSSKTEEAQEFIKQRENELHRVGLILQQKEQDLSKA